MFMLQHSCLVMYTTKEEVGCYGPPDQDDDPDCDHGRVAPARADPLDPLANFIKYLKVLSPMSGSDIAALVSYLPAPQDG